MARVISLQQYLARPRLRGLLDEAYEYVAGGSEPGPGGGGSGSGGFQANPTVAAADMAKIKMLRADGEAAHKAGKHDDSMKALGEAKKMLGI